MTVGIGLFLTGLGCFMVGVWVGCRTCRTLMMDWMASAAVTKLSRQELLLLQTLMRKIAKPTPRSGLSLTDAGGSSSAADADRSG